MFAKWLSDTLISIHALLAESDIVSVGLLMFNLYFYPRSPCGERHNSANTNLPSHCNFYPRSPCGERHGNPDTYALSNYFYPRSPCGERHRTATNRRPIFYDFYPRSPCGERHLRVVDGSKSSIISIHALLAESDGVFCYLDNIEIIISIHALLAESDLDL